MRAKKTTAVLDWSTAIKSRAFVIISILGAAALLLFAQKSPAFYHFIENRTGTIIHDKVLHWLPAVNVSIPIFIIIWATVLLFLVRCIKYPSTFIVMLLSYTIFCCFRYSVIFLVPLEPPHGLIELKDPFTDVFYGGYFITKDLFFSGHVGTEVLFMLAMVRRQDRWLLSIASALLAMFILVQHVHYTIDVLAAPFFSVLSYLTAVKVLQKFGIVTGSSLQVDLPIPLEKA